MATVAGRDNTIGMPVYLLPLNTDGLLVDENTGGTLTLPAAPGFSLTVEAGSATFPGGGKSGTITVTVVHNDKIPMTPNFGQQPGFVVTLQPAGVHFGPPAPISYPNVDGLAPGEITELYSFDHDMGRFVSIGTGTVTEDGAIIVSDPGVGIIKSGWGAAGPPNPAGAAQNTDVEITGGGPVVPVPQANNAPAAAYSPTSQPTQHGQALQIFQPQAINFQERPLVGDSYESGSYATQDFLGRLRQRAKGLMTSLTLPTMGFLERSKQSFVRTLSSPWQVVAQAWASHTRTANAEKLSAIVGPASVVMPLGSGRKVTAVGTPPPGTFRWTFNDPDIVDLLCPCDPADFDASFVTVEGKALGTGTISIKYTADSGAVDNDTTDVHVMVVDLDIEGVDDANDDDGQDELNKGGFIGVNDDDDNNNNTQDRNDPGSTTGENDLKKINLKVEPANISGQVILAAQFGGEKIKVWEGNDRTNQVVLPKTYANIAQVPSNLYVEGVGASTAGKDVELRLTFKHTPPGGSSTSIVDRVKFTVVQIIFEINTPSDGATPPGNNSFMGARPAAAADTGDQIELKGRVIGRTELNSTISWTATLVGPHTGAPVPTTAVGATFQFRAVSAQSIARRVPRNNDPHKLPLQYQVVAKVTIDGVVIEDSSPPLLTGETAETRLPFPPIRQDERDIIRQEYVDFGTTFQPTRVLVDALANDLFNTGNYGMVAEETDDNLQTLLDSIQANFDALLNNDVQEVEVGTCTGNVDPDENCVGGNPNTVVISPGPGFTTAGRPVTFRGLGDTMPEGDDGCTILPLVNGVCTGSVTVGPNFIAETTANNVDENVDLGDSINSAYRNPQRNRDVGSQFVNSRHTRGRALDIDPDSFTVAGKTNAQLYCYLEEAAENATGSHGPVDSAVTETGPDTFTTCIGAGRLVVHIQN